MSAKELEVGMYVRTNSGLIAKLLKIDTEKQRYRFDDNVRWFYEYYRDDIDFDEYDDWLENYEPKFAKRLIDLIEIGDYVNGELVEDTTGEYLRVNGQSHNKYYFSKQIESIVTKEQFESQKYNVKVKDND